MRIALTAALACAVAACMALSVGNEAAYRPQVILDSYLIAHGMAAGYAESANASPAVLEQLSKLDQRAVQAVRELAQRHGADPARSASAVAALAEYAARQSSDQTR